MEFHPDGGGGFDAVKEVSGKWLVMPAVSIGNVGQLAVDVLLATLKAEKLAVGRHRRLLPAVGPGSSSSSSDLAAPMELYRCPSAVAADLCLAQIRSEVIRGGADEFLGDLLAWCRRSGVAGIVLLSSLSAAERVDSQLGPSARQSRFLANAPELVRDLKDSGLEELERRSRFPAAAHPNQDADDQEIFIPGGGFTKRLFRMMTTTTTMSSSSSSSSPSLPLVCLMAFASEGNNASDAVNLALEFNRWKKVMDDDDDDEKKRKLELRFPDSWRHLFGQAPPPAIY